MRRHLLPQIGDNADANVHDRCVPEERFHKEKASTKEEKEG